MRIAVLSGLSEIVVTGSRERFPIFIIWSNPFAQPFRRLRDDLQYAQILERSQSREGLGKYEVSPAEHTHLVGPERIVPPGSLAAGVCLVYYVVMEKRGRWMHSMAPDNLIASDRRRPPMRAARMVS